MTASQTLDLGDGLTVTFTEQGDRTKGRAALVLHGGAGPRSVAGLASTLAENAYVLTPIHAGFDGTPRPDWHDSVADLATDYLDLLDHLDLRDVLVLGSSIGGWIAAEMALRDTHNRIGGVVLLNAVGINADTPIVDTQTITPAELGRLSFVNPALRPDFSTLDETQLAAVAANRKTLEVYAGTDMYDPKLRRRLHRVTVPVRIIWGEQDGIAPLDYGRAFAESFPSADFHPIADAAHFPHIEQPEATMAAIDAFSPAWTHA
jgi:pimeloyl-ACP methyl ester carboxylesterase